MYKALDSSNNATFAYCRKDKQWVFLKEDRDPCFTESEKKTKGDFELLAHSSDTFSFDISSAFDIPWRSPRSPYINKYLDMYFIANSNNAKEPEDLSCYDTIGDGKCDDALNNFFYNWDGGDCCAATCASSTSNDCGEENVTVFEGNGVGFHFPSCDDNSMVELSITISAFENISIYDSSRFEWVNDTYDLGWEDFPNPTFDLVCNNKKVLSSELDQSMKNSTEVVKVSMEESTCSLILSTFEPAFNVVINSTGLFHENGGSVETIIQNFIPTAIGTLDNLLSLDLSGLDLQGSIPNEIGSLEDLQFINLRDNALTGTIPVGIFSLQNLTILNLGFNDLTGTIPTEIGRLKDLERLDLGSNSLTGKIPTEISKLTKLRYLNLIGAGNPGLRGSFNCTSLPNLLDKTMCFQNQNIIWTAAPSISVQPSLSVSSLAAPSAAPSVSTSPSEYPSRTFSPTATASPTKTPLPSTNPSKSFLLPSRLPSEVPSISPSSMPSGGPSNFPSFSPSASPSTLPSELPTASPSALPTKNPTESPSQSPSYQSVVDLLC